MKFPWLTAGASFLGASVAITVGGKLGLDAYGIISLAAFLSMMGATAVELLGTAMMVRHLLTQMHASIISVSRKQ